MGKKEGSRDYPPGMPRMVDVLLFGNLACAVNHRGLHGERLPKEIQNSADFKHGTFSPLLVLLYTSTAKSSLRIGSTNHIFPLDGRIANHAFTSLLYFPMRHLPKWE